jgi:putative DNA primase/helicase
VWLAFLDRIMARDSTLIGFLQRAIGYSLTGSVSEQVLFFLHGTGANGKSTLTTVLLQLLGDYGRQAAPGLLMAKKGEAHPTAEADLFGARLVVSQEIDQNRLLAEGTVKQLTGGDRMKVRRMREDFWEFTPTHKIWLSANHKPIVHGVDHAIWRRILLLPFAVTIPKDEWDLKLAEKLTAELPGIFAWAVRGCLAWRERGLDPPARVSAATQAYRTEMDSLGEFIAERCLIDPKASSPRSALFTAYKDWAEKAGYSKPLTSIGFGRQIGERPEVAGGASHGGRYWCGIRPWTALELATRMKAEGEAAAAEVAERVRKRAEEAGLTTVQGGLK